MISQLLFSGDLIIYFSNIIVMSLFCDSKNQASFKLNAYAMFSVK